MNLILLFQVVTWKRYNDFKQLYKSMLCLHKSLHRKDEFPKFAKPLLFGNAFYIYQHSN